MTMRYMRVLLFSMLSLGLAMAVASNQYFLCGSDEDGCFFDDPTSCVCIPKDDATANEPYCLGFQTLRCQPLSTTPQCKEHGGWVTANQSDCVALFFQSEAKPACPTVSHEFCVMHHVIMYPPDGRLQFSAAQLLRLSRLQQLKTNQSLHVKYTRLFV